VKQTLRDKLHAPAIIAAAIRLPTGDAGYLWALPLINALGETRDDQLISEIQGGMRPSRSTNTRPGLVVNGVPLCTRKCRARRGNFNLKFSLM
jgi:hypothetical protein